MWKNWGILGKIGEEIRGMGENGDIWGEIVKNWAIWGKIGEIWGEIGGFGEKLGEN